jgi:plastocyanin
MNTKTIRVLVAASAAVLALAACSSDSKSSSGSPTTTASGGGAAAVGLTIQGSSFSAATVKAGQAFTIQNKDGVTHTVTEDNGAFDQSLPGGGSATLTIATPGTYKIHCRIHSSMHGTIVVT